MWLRGYRRAWLGRDAVAGSDDPAGTAALLALLAGGFLLGAGLVRLGFLADLISLPILTGYKAGIGLVILTGQLGKVLGIPVDGEGFFAEVADLVRGLDDIDWPSAALGGATIVLLVVLPRLAPAVPAPLVAVAAGIVAVAVLEPDVDVVGAAGLVRPAELRLIARVRTRDFRLALVALAGVLVLGVLDGIMVAVLASIVVLSYQANRPPVDVAHDADGVLVLRPRGRLYFANVRRTAELIRAAVAATDPQPRVTVLDVVAVPDLEITAVAALHDLADDLAERGIVLWIASLTPDERRMIERYRPEASVPVFPTAEHAVTAARTVG